MFKECTNVGLMTHYKSISTEDPVNIFFNKVLCVSTLDITNKLLRESIFSKNGMK